MRTYATAALISLLAAWPAVPAQAAEAKADDARIRELVGRLGADDYRTREQAQAELVKVGPSAIPPLEKALAETSDPEVKLRAGQILPELRKQAAKLMAARIKENLLWTEPLAEPVNGRLVAAGGCVLVQGRTGKITAVDIATRKVGWQAAGKKDVPAIVAGTVAYVVSPAGDLEAIDLKTGKATDGFKAGAVSGEPVLADGVIYALGSDKVFRAMDGRTGECKWEAKVEAGDSCPPPAVWEKAVFVGTGGGKVAALDRGTGKMIWRAQVGVGDVQALAVCGDVLVIRSVDRVCGLDAASGKMMWTTRPFMNAAIAAKVQQLVIVNGQVIRKGEGAALDGSGLAVAGDTVYLAGDSRLIAVNARTGQHVWSCSPGEKAGGDEDAGNANVPLIIGGNGMMRVRIQGNVVGPGGLVVVGAGFGGLGEPLLDGDVIYCGSAKGLHAVDRRSGEPLWVFETSDPVVGRPVIADGVIYFVAAGEGGRSTLHAVRIKEAK